MMRVRADAAMRTDDCGDTTRLPQIIRKARGQCSSLNQVRAQQELLLGQLWWRARTWFGQQACTTFVLKAAHSIGNGAAGQAEADSHFALRMLARNHNQAAEAPPDITGGGAFRCCCKLCQMAQTAVAQVEPFTVPSHRYPLGGREDMGFEEFA